MRRVYCSVDHFEEAHGTQVFQEIRCRGVLIQSALGELSEIF